MSHMPKLDGAPINLAALREHSRQELMAALDSVSSPEGGPGKALVLDPALSGPLGLIAEVKEFKEHGVEKIYHLLTEPLSSDSRAVCHRGLEPQTSRQGPRQVCYPRA